MSHRRSRRDSRQNLPEPVEYTLTAKGEVLGTVEVRRSRERLFMGYFHPARAFSRVVRLFDEYNRAADRYVRLRDSDFRTSTSPALRRGAPLDVSEARRRAWVAQDIAGQALAALGLELHDSNGRPVETVYIGIGRVRIEEEMELYEIADGRLAGPSPFEEIDAGVDVTPYRLLGRMAAEDEAGRKPRWGVPWSPDEGRTDTAEEDSLWFVAADLERDDEEDSDEKVDFDDELEWEGSQPPFENRVTLWHRAVSGHPRDTLLRVLDLAQPQYSNDPEDRDLWVKSVQYARTEGLLDEQLSQYLIWRIVTDAHDEVSERDPSLLELLARMDAVAVKHGLDPEAADEISDPPAEWAEINTAWLARGAQMINEVLLAAGELSLEAAMREQPAEFAARMAAWEERVKRGHEERQRR
jgi:hypothetical protein